MIKIFNHYVSKVVCILIAVEIGILFAAAYLGVNIRLFGDHRWSHSVEGFLPSAFAFAMAIVAGMSALGMYEFNFGEGLRKTFLRLMPSLGLGLGILVVVFYFAPDLYFGRGILFPGPDACGIGHLHIQGDIFQNVRIQIAGDQNHVFWRQRVGPGVQRFNPESFPAT